MRVINRPLAFLLAAALLVAGVILIVEVIALAVHAKPVFVSWPVWHRWAERTAWKAGVVRFWSIVLIVVGMLLLVVELKPRRDNRLRIASDSDATDAAITRRGLSTALRGAATGIDGVSDARVAASRRRVSVSARAAAQDSAAVKALEEPIRAAVQQRLDALQMHTPPRVSVQVTAGSR